MFLHTDFSRHAHTSHGYFHQEFPHLLLKTLMQVPSQIHYRLFLCVSTLLAHSTVLGLLNRQGGIALSHWHAWKYYRLPMCQGSALESQSRHTLLLLTIKRWVRHVGPHGAQLVDKDTGKLHWIPESPLWHALTRASAGLSSHRLWRWPSHVHCREGIFLTNKMVWSLPLTLQPHCSTVYPFVLKYFADKSWTGLLTNAVWERCF